MYEEDDNIPLTLSNFTTAVNNDPVISISFPKDAVSESPRNHYARMLQELPEVFIGKQPKRSGENKTTARRSPGVGALEETPVMAAGSERTSRAEEETYGDGYNLGYIPAAGEDVVTSEAVGGTNYGQPSYNTVSTYYNVGNVGASASSEYESPGYEGASGEAP